MITVNVYDVKTNTLKRKVELTKHVQNLEALVKKIQEFYNTLCNVPRLTNKFQVHNQKIEGDLKVSGSIISQSIGSSVMHYDRSLYAQGRLDEI